MSDSSNDEQFGVAPGLERSEAETGVPSPLAEEAPITDPSGGQSRTPDAATQERVSEPVIELKANQLSSIEDLIRFAYQQAGRRLTVPGSVVRKFAAGAQIDEGSPEPMYTLVVELLGTDPTLAVPPRVLAFAALAKPAIHIRRRLENTMAVALRRHALFDVRHLREALDTRPDEIDSVLDGLREAAARVTPQRLGMDTDALRPAQRDKMYVNAAVSLTLLMALRDGWPTDAVVDVLYRRVWRDSADVADRLVSIGALADVRDSAALATVGRVFDRQRRDAERKARDAEIEAGQARSRAFSADAELQDRDVRIARLEQHSTDLSHEIEGLRTALAAEEQHRLHDRSHHVDDYEKLRTRMVRVLGKQVELLSDGLHALRDGHANVTDEYIDRTIGALRAEIEHLRPQGGL